MSNMYVLLSIGLAQLLAVISPGPSFLITARTAVAQSRLDGIKVALGLGAGTVVWASATFLGFNLLFHALPGLFTVMKIAGALFLLWVAFQIFRHASEPIALDLGKEEGLPNPFMKGFWTQMSNPKVLAFFSSIFIAMLPPHVPLWMQLSLIAIVTFNEVWWYTAVSLFFGTGPVRRFYLKAKKWIDRVTGLFLGALGLRLLWAAREAA
jgi:threonine/homoserine/homoserine lactone efflux protein